MSSRFFKSKTLEKLGTFQDGGLQHNNPIKLALWELGVIFPGRSSPDFALSVGTGKTDSVLTAFDAGPHSPVKDRFISRLFQTFMESLDGEKIWQDLINSLPESNHAKFHRLNLPIRGGEPLLDDVTAMQDLKCQTTTFLQSPNVTTDILDSLFASIFYFEFDGMPCWQGSLYTCTGNVFCRLRLPLKGRKALQEMLVRTSSYFLVLGEPVRCVERTVANPPLFKKQVKFTLKTLEDTVGITLRGATSRPRTISGLSKKAEDIIRMQMLDAPFGRHDHVSAEKELPQLPKKRKFCQR